MPSAFRHPKNLSEWIELDYHERPRGLKRWKRLLVWGTLAVCLAGAAVAMVLPRGSRMVQAGPLTLEHNMFNDDCARCHEGAFQTAKKLAPWNADAHAVPNRACVQCHDGPPHNLQIREEREPACAGCHQEHRGKVSLTRVGDAHCVGCHGDLANHRKSGAEGLKFQNIHAFNDDHPEFAVIRESIKDPGQLQFNHKAHLRGKLKSAPNAAEVQLSCVDCHRPDEAGRYMEPIRYDKHCASCHPLTVQLTGDFKAAGAMKEWLDRAVEEFNKKPAPHDRPEVVRGVLRERLLEFVQEFPVVAGEKPGRALDHLLLPRARSRPPSDVEWQSTRQELVKTIDRLMFVEPQKQANERLLLQGSCRVCHVEDRRTAAGTELTALPVFKPTNVPARWMAHARFNHERHRMLDCNECHKAGDSDKSSDVLMPALRSCQQCHTPKAGARHDCVECHTYHARPLKDPARKGMTINECLGR